MQKAILNLGIAGLMDEMLKVELDDEDEDSDEDEDYGLTAEEKEADKAAYDLLIDMLAGFNKFLLALLKDNPRVQEELYECVPPPKGVVVS